MPVIFDVDSESESLIGVINKEGSSKTCFNQCSSKAPKYNIPDMKESNSQELLNAAASYRLCKCQTEGSFDADGTLRIIAEIKLIEKYNQKLSAQQSQH